MSKPKPTSPASLFTAPPPPVLEAAQVPEPTPEPVSPLVPEPTPEPVPEPTSGPAPAPLPPAVPTLLVDVPHGYAIAVYGQQDANGRPLVVRPGVPTEVIADGWVKAQLTYGVLKEV